MDFNTFFDTSRAQLRQGKPAQVKLGRVERHRPVGLIHTNTRSPACGGLYWYDIVFSYFLFIFTFDAECCITFTCSAVPKTGTGGAKHSPGLKIICQNSFTVLYWPIIFKIFLGNFQNTNYRNWSQNYFPMPYQIHPNLF